MKRVLIVGGGGREHALAHVLRRSPLLAELHCAPGNPGIARLATCHPVGVDDVDGLVRLATSLRIDLVVVGPEAPLVAGVGDALRAVGIPVFGPGRAAAQLEGSKAFAKEVMAAAGVPTAASRTVTTLDEARAAIAELGESVVVKADGLAAGKGVVVCADGDEADRAARALLDGALGEAGRRLVVEERLEGPEVSLLAICDGAVAVPLPAAQDFKRIGDGDAGPNTGGMGAYSPVPGVDDARARELAALVHVPVLGELQRRGVRFRGCLYAGLMLTSAGPRVLEYNVRFGDPETQAVLPRLADDLLERLLEAAEGRLTDRPFAVRPSASVAVVVASRGYPASSESGVPIEGVEAAEQEGAMVFHAGTALRDGRLVTAGGRVLAVTALGEDIGRARAAAYAAAEHVRFDGSQRRSDIARAAAEREAAGG